MPVLVVSAPSGAGKTTLIQRIREKHSFSYSVSHTTRAQREGEVNGINYHFVSVDEFQHLKNMGHFLETTHIHGHYYGTAWKNFIAPIDDPHRWLLLDLDVKGLRSLKEKIIDVVSVFILPPSIHVLSERILKRQPNIQRAELDMRLEKAREEMTHVFEYDYSVFNSDLDQATEEMSAILRAEMLRNFRRKAFLESLMY